MADKALLPVYLMSGEDQLKREFLVKRLTSRIEAYGDLDFNKDSFLGSAVSADELVASCNTMPFMSEYRMVVVKDVDKASKAVTEAIVSYLENPCDTTVLAMTANKLAKNTRLYKAVAKVDKKAVVDCSPKDKRDLPAQVRDLALSNGVTISPKAATELISMVGESTVHLDTELKKMVAALGKGTEITVAHVEQFVTRTNEPKYWEFVDTFSDRDAKKALTLLSRMPSQTPISMHMRCVSRLRELLLAKELGGGAPLAQALGMPDWRVRNHGRWASKFSEQELVDALVSAARLERAMKSGADQATAFEQWVLQVCAVR